MSRLKKAVRSLFRHTAQWAIVGLITLLLFELIFRIYLIDFYGSSFKYLNEDFAQRENGKELLLVGDSFSAFKDGYAKVLYDSLPDYNVSNISVPGTSIREQFLFGRHYLKRKKPDVLVFQFYVGNDLFGWDHPLNWGEISPQRNLYWWLSERLWSLSFINHKLVYFKFSNSNSKERPDTFDVPFSPDRFSKRDITYFQAEPGLVENSVLLKNGRDKDLEQYLERMERLFAYASEDCQIYILVVPHAAQVNPRYKRRSEALGAEYSKGFDPGVEPNPLLTTMESFFSNDKRVRLVDIKRTLSNSEKAGVQVYFSNDSHLNNTGQDLMGSLLLQYLK